jgi:hypothetical protein
MINDPMPPPHTGPLGVWDRLVGPGADPFENALIVGAMVAAPGLASAWAWVTGADWRWWQWLIVAFFACELFGGLMADALPAAKRWHHRPGQGGRQLFAFCLLHVHPLVLAVAIPTALSVRTGVIVYGLMLAGAGASIAAPPRFKGAVGLMACVIAPILCAIWLPLISPLGWLPSVLFLRVLAAHLTPPPSAPYVETTLPHGPWS